MTHWIRFGIVVVAALGSERYELSLTQQGDVIEGVVCSMVSGILGYKDVAVSGRYPNVNFDLSGPGPSVIPGGDPSFIIRVFSGKFEAGRDQIAGNLRDTPLRFNRISTDGQYGRCSGARPRP